MTNEGKLYALYQSTAESASQHNDAGSWHLMRVNLLESNLSVGVYDLSEAKFVGLAKQIPAVFESGHLIIDNKPESILVINEVQSDLRISGVEITQALENGKFIVYSYSDPQT